MNENTHHAPHLTPHASRLTLVLILLLAFFLRVWRLDSIPPGLTHDEAGHGQDALAILHGARPLYETVGYGREPLYDYVVATAMAFVGRADYWLLRWVSAVCGLLTVVITYSWIRRAFGGREALLTCAWLALSFWAVAASRQALRSVMLPPLLAAAACAWWRGADLTPLATAVAPGGLSAGPLPARMLAKKRVLWFVLSGVFIAATLWTYMAARATWMLWGVLPIFLLVTDRERFKRHWPGMLLALTVAAILAAPMFIWLQQHPGAEQRFNQLGQPLQLLATGDVRQIAANGLEALGMFTVRADALWLYNLPGRPWLGAIDGALFYAGLAIAIWRWRRPQYAFALLWLMAGLFPSLITGVSASATRAVAILPVLYLFPAIALIALFQISDFRFQISDFKISDSRSKIFESALRKTRLLCSRVPLSPCPLVPLSLYLLVSLLIAFEGARTCHDYFDVWGNARDVRVAYHTTLFEIAHDLDRQSILPGTTVVLSSIYPGRYHDPYTLDLMMSRHDLSLRWIDGRGALIFPGDAVRLIVPAIAPLDPALAQGIAPNTRLLESHFLRPDDLNPRFDVYEWDSLLTLPSPTVTREIELGHTIALIDYELSSQVAAPGDEITLVTYWRILSPPDPELDTVLFTHLLSPGGTLPLVAQQDRLDAPTWNWHTGEVFAQVHRLKIGNDVAEGWYPLEVGAYTRPGPTPLAPNPPTTRLIMYIDGQPGGDHILLPPLKINSKFQISDGKVVK